jgi:hypothetical protein
MAAAKRQAAGAGDHAPNETGRRRRKRRRPTLARRSPVVLILLIGLLTLAAVAYATTQLIQTGSPVKSEEPFSRDTGAGVAIPKTEGLLGIAAADPEGGPPWTMRAFKTSRGLGCVQVGRLVAGRIGVMGQDGAFNDDARFHPLPTQASQAEGQCVLLDGNGHAFLGAQNYGQPASGLPHQCHLLRGDLAVRERCLRSDSRDIFYGLLGPDARSITYTLNGRIKTTPTVGADGAYLIVERTPVTVLATGVGGGAAGALPAGEGTVNGVALPQPIRKITYTDGRTCTIEQTRERNGRGGSCEPPVGYVTQQLPVPSPRQMASAIDVKASSGPPVEGVLGTGPVRELIVSFTAHAAVRSALSGYNVTLQAPETAKRCKRPYAAQANAIVGRNVRAGEAIHLTLTSPYANRVSMFPGCPGTAHGRVFYSIPSFELSSAASYGPFARQGSRMVAVGYFTYRNPR